MKLFNLDLTAKGLHLGMRVQLGKWPPAENKKVTFFKSRTKPIMLKGKHLFEY